MFNNSCDRRAILPTVISHFSCKGGMFTKHRGKPDFEIFHSVVIYKKLHKLILISDGKLSGHSSVPTKHIQVWRLSLPNVINNYDKTILFLSACVINVSYNICLFDIAFVLFQLGMLFPFDCFLIWEFLIFLWHILFDWNTVYLIIDSWPTSILIFDIIYAIRCIYFTFIFISSICWKTF